MIGILKSFIRSLFPKRCAYCGKVIASNRTMCCECELNLPRVKSDVCTKCGMEKVFCSCKGAEKYFAELAAPFYFENNVRKGLHAFKFRKCPDNAEAYCIEMAQTVKQRFSGVHFDFITEVPMTEKSLKKRGYNQCALLAKGISELLNIEHKPDLLVKLFDTQIQHGLSYYLRKGNINGVFDVADPVLIKDKTILLCDDVSTTGATLNECAKMLWLYGAKDVYCISCALTKSKKNNTKERK